LTAVAWFEEVGEVPMLWMEQGDGGGGGGGSFRYGYSYDVVIGFLVTGQRRDFV
jgi:hypothetical protein